jgi:hypothetical protein
VDGIKRTAHSASQKTSSAASHRTVQKSTTLNRRFVKKPVAKKVQIVSDKGAHKQTISNVSARASQAARRATGTMVSRTQRVKLSPISKAQQAKAQQQQAAKAQAQQAQDQAKQQAQRATQKSAQAQAAERIVAARAMPNPQIEAHANESAVARATRMRIQARRQQSRQVHMSSQEMKERAISDALNKISAMDKSEARKQTAQAKSGKQRSHLFAALSFAVISLALLGYLVYLNLPDLSVRVAAMNSGIENAYPSYVPMNYRLQGLAKEDNGTITMNFTRNDGGRFTMIEKKSSWDSSALLNNFVKDNWGDDYTVAKGQGLTIYISGSNAVWVNGGVMYQIEAAENTLSADDLHDIAISL